MTLVRTRPRRWPAAVVLLFLGLALQGGMVAPAVAQEESSCLTCHTSVRDLVNITRQLDAKRPPKSAEISGEG